jgi:hypothetical protein
MYSVMSGLMSSIMSMKYEDHDIGLEQNHTIFI